MPNRKYENSITVDLGGGAQACVARSSLQYRLRYGKSPDVVAASVVDTFTHLIMECTQKEQIWRLRLMKAAMRELEAQP